MDEMQVVDDMDAAAQDEDEVVDMDEEVADMDAEMDDSEQIGAADDNIFD